MRDIFQAFQFDETFYWPPFLMMRRRGAARRGSKLPRHCHPLGEAETISLWEILLIGSSRGLRPSRAHPGAERTDSPPHHPFSDSADPLRKNQRVSTAHVAGNDWKSRGFTPSRALPRGWFDESSRFRRRGAWGALLPYTPSGMGCERGTPLSRSPWGWSGGKLPFSAKPFELS